MPPKNVNLFFSFSSTNTCFKFWNDVRTIPGKANACAYEGLFKKLTPYIITWLAGFGTPDPIQDKKKSVSNELCWVSEHDRHYMRPIETAEECLGKTDRAIKSERKRENVMRALGLERGHNLANDPT